MVHSSQLRVYKIVTIAVAHFKIMLSLSVVIVLIFLRLLLFNVISCYVILLKQSTIYSHYIHKFILCFTTICGVCQLLWVVITDFCFLNFFTDTVSISSPYFYTYLTRCYI